VRQSSAHTWPSSSRTLTYMDGMQQWFCELSKHSQLAVVAMTAHSTHGMPMVVCTTQSVLGAIDAQGPARTVFSGSHGVRAVCVCSR
jgi:hypothetical protein